jgi:hypothetical protein
VHSNRGGGGAVAPRSKSWTFLHFFKNWHYRIFLSLCSKWNNAKRIGGHRATKHCHRSVAIVTNYVLPKQT